jgi:hypothetical protein
MKNLGGRPKDERRWAYVKRFGLNPIRPHHKLTTKLLDQLDRCKDDEARRLILGVKW